MAETQKKIVAVIGGDASGIKKAAGETKKALHEVEDSAKRTGEQGSQSIKSLQGALADVALAAGAVAAGMALTGGAALASFAKFDRQFSAVRGRLQDTGGAVRELQQQTLDLSSTYGIALADAAKGASAAILGGRGPADALMLMDASAQLATASGGEFSSTVEGLGRVMTAYGLRAGEATDVTDRLLASARTGRTSVADLFNVLEATDGAAAKFGISFEQILAAFSSLTSNGFSAAGATKELKRVLEDTKNEADLAQSGLNSFFDTSGARASNFYGETKAALERVNSSFGEQLDKLVESAKNLLPRLGLALEPVGAAVVEKLQGGVGGLEDMIKKRETAVLERKETIREAVDVLGDAVGAFVQEVTGADMSKFGEGVDRTLKSITENKEDILKTARELGQSFKIMIDDIGDRFNGLSRHTETLGKLLNGIASIIEAWAKFSSLFTSESWQSITQHWGTKLTERPGSVDVGASSVAGWQPPQFATPSLEASRARYGLDPATNTLTTVNMGGLNISGSSPGSLDSVRQAMAEGERFARRGATTAATARPR